MENNNENIPLQQLNLIITQISELYSKSQQEQMNMLSEILIRIEKLEKTYVSINADLINQNIKMSELLNGKLEEPEFEMPQSTNSNGSNGSNRSNDNNSTNSNNETRVKELFFYEKNGQFSIHGPGTFDNKTQIKSLGSSEWNSINKTWDIVTTREKIIETFPNIVEKEK